MPKPRGERAALLKAICDEPEDDTPRLVYADWLDEHAGSEADRARAEFIRLQVAEAAKPVTWLNKRPWAKREYDLYRAHRLAWEAELPTYPGVFVSGGNEYVGNYERGFPFDAYAKSVRSFLKAGPDLFARVPVTDIRFEVITPKTAGELTRSPFLARIRHLDQLNGITDAALEGLAASPHLCNLMKVVFGGHEVTAEGLQPFLLSPALTRLREFMTLNCGNVGSGVVPALVLSPSAAALEDVCLQDNGLGPDAAVVDLPGLVLLPRLRRLNISSNRLLGDEGAEAVAGVSVSGEMQINLGWNGITDRGAEAILHGPLLRSPGVRLNLEGGNPITDRMKARLKDAFGDRVAV
jgi:uncharacterized protein (TIGR02996 family)